MQNIDGHVELHGVYGTIGVPLCGPRLFQELPDLLPSTASPSDAYHQTVPHSRRRQCRPVRPRGIPASHPLPIPSKTVTFLQEPSSLVSFDYPTSRISSPQLICQQNLHPKWARSKISLSALLQLFIPSGQDQRACACVTGVHILRTRPGRWIRQPELRRLSTLRIRFLVASYAKLKIYRRKTTHL